MRKIYKIIPSSLSGRYFKDVHIGCERCNWMGMNTGRPASLALPLVNRVTKDLEDGIDGQPTEKFLPEPDKGKVTKTGGYVSSIKFPIDTKHDFFIAREYDDLAELEKRTVAEIDDEFPNLGGAPKFLVR